MARRKKKSTGHRKTRRRKMGALGGNGMLELFIGAAVGGVAGYLVVNDAKILPTMDAETKNFILGGIAYFVPKVMPGDIGTGVGLGMAGAAAIGLGKGLGFISGATNAYAGNIPVIGNRSRNLLGNGGIPVIGRAGMGRVGKIGPDMDNGVQAPRGRSAYAGANM